MRAMAVLAALTLTGCANGVWGIYLIELEPLPELACDTQVTENWDNASPASEGSSEWTYTTDVDASAGLVFAELVELQAKQEAVLIVGDEAYKGTWDGGAKEWVFVHGNVVDGTQSDDHVSGYHFEQSGLSRVDRTFRMNLKDGAGALEIAQTVDTSWTETDEWDAAVGFSSGQINGAAVTYLDGNRILNDSTGPECDGELCELSVVQSCDGSTTFSFVAVQAGDDVFGSLEDAGQPIGFGDD